MEEANDDEFAQLLKELEVPSPTALGKRRRGRPNVKKSKRELEKEKVLRLELERELDEACERHNNFRFQRHVNPSVLDYGRKAKSIEASTVDSDLAISKKPVIKERVITQAGKKRATRRLLRDARIPYNNDNYTLRMNPKKNLQRKSSSVIKCRRRRIKREVLREIEVGQIGLFDSYVDHSGTVNCKEVTLSAKEHMRKIKIEIEEAMRELEHCREKPKLFTSDVILRLKLEAYNKVLIEISSRMRRLQEREPNSVNPFFDQIAFKLHPCSVNGFARGISRSFHPIMLLKDADCCFSIPESLIWTTQPFTGLVHMRKENVDEDNLIHFLDKISGCKEKARKDPFDCALQLVRSKLGLGFDPLSCLKMHDDSKVKIGENSQKPVGDREMSALSTAPFISPMKEKGFAVTPIPAYDSSLIQILPQMEISHSLANNRDCTNTAGWQNASILNSFDVHNSSHSTIDLLLNEAGDSTSEMNFCTECFDEL